MNKERRKVCEEIIDQLRTLKKQVEEVRNEEKQAFSFLPDSIQHSERGQDMKENIEAIDDAADNIDRAMWKLQNVIES